MTRPAEGGREQQDVKPAVQEQVFEPDRVADRVEPICNTLEAERVLHGRQRSADGSFAGRLPALAWQQQVQLQGLMRLARVPMKCLQATLWALSEV